MLTMAAIEPCCCVEVLAACGMNAFDGLLQVWSFIATGWGWQMDVQHSIKSSSSSSCYPLSHSIKCHLHAFSLGGEDGYNSPRCMCCMALVEFSLCWVWLGTGRSVWLVLAVAGC
jgi:hypothetical protein